METDKINHRIRKLEKDGEGNWLRRKGWGRGKAAAEPIGSNDQIVVESNGPLVMVTLLHPLNPLAFTSISVPPFLCSSPVISPVFTNSTFSEIVSPCLANVVFPFVPAIVSVFSLLCLFLYARLFRPNAIPLPINRLIILKGALSTLDLFVSLLRFTLIFFVLPISLPEQRVGSTIDLLFSLCSTFAYAQCVRVGLVSSGPLHIAWFLRLVSLLPCHALLLFGPPLTLPQVPSSLLLPVLHLVISFALVLLFVVSDFSPPSNYQRVVGPTGKEISPEESTSAFSAVIYSYATKMFFKGLHGDVTFDDLWELHKERQAEVLMERYYRADKTKGEGPITFFSFVWRLVKCTWEWQICSILLSVLVVFCLYANAIFLRVIVTFVNLGFPLWLSMTALCVLFFVDFTGKVMLARRDFDSFIALLSLRSIISCAILDKLFKLSSSARQSFSTGEVVNFLSTDLFRISYFWLTIRSFVYCPFMIGFASFGLWMELGMSSVFGFAVLAMTLPINAVLTKLMTHFENKQMKIKDDRVKFVTDVLGGIKVVKLYAWEESMQKRIFELRHREVKNLWMIFLLDVFINLSFMLAPLIATLVSFSAFTIIYHQTMRPDVAFVSLLFFAMLRYAIYQIPQTISYSAQAFVSIRRVLKFLNADEQQQSHIIQAANGVEQNKTAKHRNGKIATDERQIGTDNSSENTTNSVILRHCSFTWESAKKETPILHLRDISLEIEAGKLVGIVGKVGSGKSSLLSAILGEMERVEKEGSKCVVRASSIGYVPQKPWIQNKTLRRNVLFDGPFNEDKYWRVLDACALKADLKLLAAGDMTEIGEKGINLSGGQKARVALARAVYMDADLYVLDDTLSAVDAHVGAHIFERVISNQKGLLAGKTRLFALNSLSFLKFCDLIVVMNDGQIDTVGTLDELKQHTEGPFAELMKEHMEKHFEGRKSRIDSSREDDPDETAVHRQLDQVLEQLAGSPLSHSLLEMRRRLESSESNGHQSLPGNSSEQQHPIASSAHPQPSEEHQQNTINDSPHNLNAMSASDLVGRITDEEELCTGMVKRRVYLDYARAFSIPLTVIYLLCLFIGSSTFQGLSNVWLAKWSTSNSTSPEESIRNLGIYGAFSSVYVFSAALSSLVLSFGAYRASLAFHDKLLHSLFRSPMAFFDRTPLGRILNRIGNDIDRIDENIPWAVGYSLSILAEAFNSIIAICIVIPFLVLVAVPLMVIFLCITHFYNVSSVQFRRLTSKSRSSHLSFVEDAYSGSDSIRIFKAIKQFRVKGYRISDICNECFIVEIFSNRWLQIRLDIVADVSVFICVAVAIWMASQGVISLGVLALVIGCGYTFTGYLGEVARFWRESEVQMVCVERVNEYINNKWEADWRAPASDRLAEWPSRGSIQFRDLCLRYREDSALVLNRLNFEIASSERVGIVGRTGAGKSSITMALFRIVEPASGQIFIDGTDITTVGLHDLRSALTIIPQDPVLFCGSLRSNIDPFDQYSDSDLWAALEKAQLKDTISGLEGTLLYKLTEKGSNLSEGQRQLVCLARALLRQRTRILILDEATAAVDTYTDSCIQQCIRTHFNHCTVLTIAHRLDTILDYDRVIVMDEGAVAEFDTPTALLADGESMFAKMAKQAGVVKE
ncbi:hypothetical protein niasHT_034996 [Heterodera trifolii]|uniref:Uncharacterized protein n=1 Tax=Heterodera trifolii TaxID=157864 RepID=A0ABD2IKQ0_9BILA